MTRSPDTDRSRWIALVVLCVGMLMIVLDATVVNVALPSIQSDLGFSQSSLAWVVNAYMIAFGGLLLLAGRLGDLISRRGVFLAGLGVFTLASLAAGVAQASGQLTTARAIQGLGGAILSPATLTIITTTFKDGHSRTKALGIWSSVGGAGGATGALFGGILTGYLNWRWVFFVNIPIGAIALALTLLVLTEERKLDSGRLDIAGAVTVTGGLALLVYAIVGTDTHPWGSARTLVLIAAAAALLAVFVFIQAKIASHPLMPLSLFRSRPLSAANLTMFLVGAGFFAMWFFLTLYLQVVHGYGPLKAGLLFMPMGLTIVVGAQASVRLVGRFGSGAVLMGALLVAAGGFFWISQLHASSTYLAGVLPGTTLTSLALGLSFTPLAQIATSGVAPQMAGLASGMLNTSRQVGGSIGLAALATVAAARAKDLRHSTAVKQALTSGYDRAFLVAAVLMLAGFAVASAIPRPRRAAPEPAIEPEVALAPLD